MKLVKIILEYGESDNTLEMLQAELTKRYGQYKPNLTMNQYSQDREKGDKLFGKGFGKLEFIVREDLPKELFNEITRFLEDKHFAITSTTSTYENEPGERRIYPSIGFNFNLRDL